MRRTVIGIYIIKERVNVYVVRFTSHVGERGGLVGFGRRTPNEKVTILITQEVDVKSIIHKLCSHIRLMVSEVAAGAEAFVVTLLSIALVSKEVQSAAYVEITDAA